MDLDNGRVTFGDSLETQTETDKAAEASSAVTDPVCGAELVRADAAAAADFQGHIYYFCSPACKQRFIEAPERYLVSPAASP
jgi:YHS domain-containing protein